jgi:hypothetical protein
MLGVYGTEAEADGVAVALADVESVQQQGAAYDVQDGVDSADLVEVDFLDGDVVYPGFGFADDLKNVFGDVFGSLRNVSRFDKSNDVAEVPVRTVMVVVMLVPVVMRVAFGGVSSGIHNVDMLADDAVFVEGLDLYLGVGQM